MICRFFGSDNGCSKGDTCPWFHVNERIYNHNKKDNSYYSVLCKKSLTNNCNVKNCKRIHLNDDIRHKNKTKELDYYREKLQESKIIIRDLLTKLEEKEKENAELQCYNMGLNDEINHNENVITDLFLRKRRRRI